MEFVEPFAQFGRTSTNRWLRTEPTKTVPVDDTKDEGTKDEEDTSTDSLDGSDNENEDSTTNEQDVNTTVPAPPTAMTMEDYEKFAARFEGLAGLDDLKAAIEAGTYTGSSLDSITESFFNNMVKDASGMLPGGWSPESGFYSSPSAGYVETYLTQPEINPRDETGNLLFIQRTLLDGRTVWERNADFKGDDDDGVGSPESIRRTEMLTDAERNAQLAAAGVEGATAILMRLVGAFGLSTSVVSKLKQFMVDGLSEEAIALEIRQTDEYKTRFPGMSIRRDNGFGSITEAEYMANEDEYAMLLRTHGLPPRFYDDRMDFANLIGQDVSPNEFGERVTLAELATKGADPATKDELKRLYGIDEPDLVAYYLDPELATNLIEERRAFEAAGLSATAASALGTTGLNRETAAALQRESVQRREIQQRLSPQAGIINQALGEQDEISASDLAAGEFGLDPEAARKVRRRREERIAESGGQSGMLISGSGATGFGAST